VLLHGAQRRPAAVVGADGHQPGLVQLLAGVADMGGDPEDGHRRAAPVVAGVLAEPFVHNDLQVVRLVGCWWWFRDGSHGVRRLRR